MADRRRRLRPGTLAPVREGVNCRSSSYQRCWKCLILTGSWRTHGLIVRTPGKE
ncbi:FAM47E-STBD1 readthrough [Homo sapiens]|uniref:FAM47E-STBD1 readthrough n=1 Tax=Homo sapiens TaxID=9606 RepID=F6W5V1_HUMAN|nr:FAM47E-STBD1 readthrough [Homo sapiens]KAI2534742.1 FAM47E-STBD1 readthrough [Homo sapiens]KAI2534743.1 FAM47E-STBD1 readthrough [Homo sapiens]KAI4025842.1 FAM47E-STBD1 readthrough [Homo sapiens]KAI4025843.1 FAM47E-STBD1 readthrough [Homo sapiens]